jgi:hypothetical protein
VTSVLEKDITINPATRVTTAMLGIIFGLSGISHGIFEALQGNIPTGGVFISAIGEAQRMWIHGNEPALTIIPNYLFSGIASILVSLAIILWSLAFVHKKHGPSVLLGLFILLFLVGGGVAQILFFPWICLLSASINSPLNWWRRVLRGRLQKMLGSLWIWSLTVCATLMLIVLLMAVTGFVPGMRDPDAIVLLMLGILSAQVVLFPLTFIAAFARDTIKSG